MHADILIRRPIFRLTHSELPYGISQRKAYITLVPPFLSPAGPGLSPHLNHYLTMASAQGEAPLIRERSTNSLKKATSRSSSNSATKEKVANDAEVLQKNDDEDTPPEFFDKFRPYMLIGLALLILGWWISATVLQATRHRW